MKCDYDIVFIDFVILVMIVLRVENSMYCIKQNLV